MTDQLDTGPEEEYTLPMTETKMLIESDSISCVANAFLVAEHGRYKVVKESVYRYDPRCGVWRVMSMEDLKAQIQSYNNRFEVFKVFKTKGGGGGEFPVEITPMLRDYVADFLVHHKPLRDNAFFDEAPRGLAVRNGFVTVTAAGATLLEHSPDHRARSYLPLEYRKDAKAPVWTQTLHEAMREIAEGAEEDAETPKRKARVLQEFYGAALFGMAPIYQRCMIVPGSGNNGKSTVLELLADILFSQEDRTSTPPQMWEREYYAAQLHDKKLNTVGELPAREIMTSSVFKQVVAGETTQGRHPRGKPFEFRPISAHIFACNNLPTTGDYSEGYWRRFLVVRFNRQFPKVGEVAGAATSADIKKPILDAERAGVLNWAVEGAVSLLANNGYSIPQEHHDALAEWRSEADPVLAWAESCLVVDNTEETPFGELYDCFKEWASVCGFKQISSVTLGRRLSAITGAKFVRRSSGKVWNLQIKPRPAWTNVSRSPNSPPLVAVDSSLTNTN